MKDGLESLQTPLPSLQEEIQQWLEEMEPIKYACLGCEHCFPAVALNLFHRAFPQDVGAESPGCAFEVREATWPPVPGEYFAFCDGPGCPVAVSTLGSPDLAERLARLRPEELCIVGKTETENIGIDKVVRNTITNPTIRFLVLAGKEPKGHQSGGTLLALWANGVDAKMRVIGAPGKRPVLRNTTPEAVDAFRKQVRVVDLIGCEDVETVVEELRKLSQEVSASCGCGGRTGEAKPLPGAAPIIQATAPVSTPLDTAGYFVVIPQPEKGLIAVEHYAYDNRLLRVIEGRNARSIYSTITDGGWVTRLSHAAYLGKELAKAELSLKLGFKYVQDGA